ncbi:MAG: pantoate--beta-alanine ligase [Bacteroidales bacterium]
MKKITTSLRKEGKTIGLVPTMGALHQGHAVLIKRARAENEIVIVSVFVNPIQFNNPADLEKYPRTLVQDLDLLQSLGCDYVFNPQVNEMYPAHEPAHEIYNFSCLDKVMEGASRPGHFQGVAVIVSKLFDLSQAHKAYFGEKDFQQLAIIQHLVKQKNINIEIVPCPIVREKDGLALSSRNMRLEPEQRALAPIIYQLLQEAKTMYPKCSPQEIQVWMSQKIKQNTAMNLEYFQIADAETLQAITKWDDCVHCVACIVVLFDTVRLIDNIRFY